MTASREVTDLDDVGPGTVVASRYRLEDRVGLTPHGSTWQAVDVSTERPVRLSLHAGPRHEDVLDAARRAAAVTDPRLQRVLDAGPVASAESTGSAADGVYVATEPPAGRTLAERLHEGPLSAAQARAVVGEVAGALERAGRGGLHHLRLTPASVLIGDDESVTVAGLAVDAAAHGTESEDAAADRVDAVALVAVLYAALTGRWPLDDPGGADAGGLAEAPRVEGVPVPPGDLLAAVPNDLDTLCSVTLGGHEDGPRTPGELARELSPWGGGTVPAAPAAEALPMRPPGRFPVSLAEVTPAALPPTAAEATADPAPTELAAGDRPDVAPAAAGRPAHLAPGAVADDQLATAEWDPPGAAGRFRRGGRNQTLVVFAVLSVLVLAGLWVAVDSLRGPDPVASTGVAAAPRTDSATEPPPSGEASPPPEAAAPAVPAPVVAGVRTLDPQGDGVENDETASRAVDDDAGSAWESSTYTTEAFGNLKDGVGLVVVLREPALVQGVTLSVAGNGGRVELRTAPGAGLEESQVVATASVSRGTAALTPEEPVQTQNLVLWFTELPRVGGSYRIELQQVQVR